MGPTVYRARHKLPISLVEPSKVLPDACSGIHHCPFGKQAVDL